MGTTVIDFESERELREVVQRVLEDNGALTGVVTELGVICAQQYFDDEGCPHTSVTMVWPDAPPHYRMLGLLEYVAARVRQQITDAEDLDDD